jgi:hypothetical protein
MTTIYYPIGHRPQPGDITSRLIAHWFFRTAVYLTFDRIVAYSRPARRAQRNSLSSGNRAGAVNLVFVN